MLINTYGGDNNNKGIKPSNRKTEEGHREDL